jgi:hypothetical protein
VAASFFNAAISPFAARFEISSPVHGKRFMKNLYSESESKSKKLSGVRE